MKISLESWIGREEIVSDTIGAGAAREMLGFLDRKPESIQPGDSLPVCWHWLYLHKPIRTSSLGADGHPKRGEFLPPVELPRRMWAGGQLRQHVPLEVGASATRRSRIAAIDEKVGRSGALVIVSVQHEILTDAGLCIEELQQLVYRERSAYSTRGEPLAESFAPHSSFPTSTVTLFRFSALTHNSHRIHYDFPYATREERYPDLLVHAPLVALLLADSAQDILRSRPVEFTYRALAPAFVNDVIGIAYHRESAETCNLGAHVSGYVTMTATASR